MTTSIADAARPGIAEERGIRRSWWGLAGAFGALAALLIVRVFAGPPQPIDVLLGGLVVVVGVVGAVHRRAIQDLDQSRRQEAEKFTRILQGLSRSVSPDAIVGAIVDELGSAAGADHTVVVRLRTESPILEATLVSTWTGVPSSTTMLPLVDLEDPGAASPSRERRPVAVAIRVEPERDDVDRDQLSMSTWTPVGPAPTAWAPGSDDRDASRPSRRRQISRPVLSAVASAQGPRPIMDLQPADGWAAATDSLSAPPADADSGGVQVHRLRPGSSRRIAERIAGRVRAVYGFKNTIAAPLLTGHGVVGAIVLSRRTSDAWPATSMRVLAAAAVEASAALERAYSHQDAEARASTDALTGLPNRRYFDEFCGLLARRRRAEDAVGVLMIDIDHFKRLNDEFGHPVGDQVLRAVAAAITRAVREGDIPARVGGEEFAVLLRNPGPALAWDIAERVRSAVGALDLSAFGPRGVTVSVGFALARAPDQSILELVEEADQALYRAKRAGRDRVVAA